MNRTQNATKGHHHHFNREPHIKIQDALFAFKIFFTIYLLPHKHERMHICTQTNILRLSQKFCHLLNFAHIRQRFDAMDWTLNFLLHTCVPLHVSLFACIYHASYAREYCLVCIAVCCVYNVHHKKVICLSCTCDVFTLINLIFYCCCF